MSELSSSTVVVAGCGAVGASIAADLSGRGLRVLGFDRRDLGPLVDRGWIAAAVGEDGLLDADLVVLALPVEAIVGALGRLPFREHQIVTDVGSVKRAVVEAAGRLPSGVRFVGGHPMAGSTGTGWEAGVRGLFQGAPWALVRSERTDARAEAAVVDLVRSLGARPVWCEAAEHDRVVALTSHVPQVLASLLAAEIAADSSPLARRLVGEGASGWLRLAGSSWATWEGILGRNADLVEAALKRILERAIPVAGLESVFEGAGSLSEPSENRGSDRPGGGSGGIRTGRDR